MPNKRTVVETHDPLHPDRVVVEEQVDPKDQPAVLAYRLGTLETAVKEGFAKQTDQITSLVKGFVTEKELHEAKQSADEEHRRIWGAISSIRNSVKWWVTTAIAGTAAISGLIYTIVTVVRH